MRLSVEVDELARCRRFATGCAQLMKGVEVGMGSKSSAGFEGFFIASNTTEPLPERIGEALMRARFERHASPASGGARSRPMVRNRFRNTSSPGER